MPSDDRSWTRYRLPGAPADPELPRRIQRLSALGLGEPDREFDAFAAQLAQRADAPYAMVNFVGETQHFAGLYAAPHTRTGAAEAALATSTAPMARTMPRDRGYCPHVVADRKAHVLRDVCAYPRFEPNPVVTELKIRAYMGAPVYDDDDGELILGTVCVVANWPTEWGRPELDLIKAAAAEASALIRRRNR